MNPIHRYLLRYGMAGLPSDASARALRWERWLNWPLFAVLFLAIPAFYIELSGRDPELLGIGRDFILVIAMSFLAHLSTMLLLHRRRMDYLRRNWMHVLIVVGASLNYFQVGSPENGLEWTLRLIWQGTAFIRLTGFLTGLLRPGSLGSVLVLAAGILAVAGLGFYWLDPAINSYFDGLWLAFVSAATVGYGDVVPTTPASRVFAVFIVLLGYAVLSLVMASIASLFVGEEEKELRREMHRDVRALRSEVAELRREIEGLRGKYPGTGPD
jgi:voltage-gated potassium channel